MNSYGFIAEIESLGLVDGPGIRTVVFLQGCNLRCKYCHNPEMWTITKNAPYKLTAKQLVKKLLKYKPYYQSNGGVTFSGGEPLLQKDFLLEALKECKKVGINTCLDTAGGINYDTNEILDNVDTVILDIKAIDANDYFNLTGMQNSNFLSFLELCQKKNKTLWLRQVIVPGINDSQKNIFALKKFIKNIKNVEKVELLPYHSMAKEKYKNLNLNYSLENVKDMDIIACKKLEELL